MTPGSNTANPRRKTVRGFLLLLPSLLTAPQGSEIPTDTFTFTVLCLPLLPFALPSPDLEVGSRHLLFMSSSIF